MSQEKRRYSDGEVIFRRINGRVVPIRVKEKKPRIKGADIASAITNAGFAGGATYKGMQKLSTRFAFASTKTNKLIKRIRTVPEPVAPGYGFGRGKNGRIKKVPPDLFELSKFNKKKARYAQLQGRLPRLSKIAHRAGKFGRFFGKASVPAALLTGAAAAWLTFTE